MIITVVNERLEEAKKELKKLVRKADRFGTSDIQYRIGATRIEEREIQCWDGEGTFKVKIAVNDIEVDGDAPVVGDYTFLARIEHSKVGNLLLTVPEHDGALDPKWRSADCSCDHCKRKRQRLDTFILRDNVNNTQIQVGRTCLQDFLGVDPASVLRRFQFFKQVRDLGEFSAHIWVRETKRILEVAATVIRLYGWCPKSQETDSTLSTASEVGIALSENAAKSERRKQVLGALTDADITLAKETLDWIRNELEPRSEYEHNLKQLLSSDVLTEPRYLGFVVSAIPAYCRYKQRQMEYARKRAADQTSEWVGTPGERLRGIKVKQEMARVVGGDVWAECILYKFKTESGAILTWITGNSTNHHNGDEFRVDFTVKDHSEWNSIKETRVTRVRVL